MATREHKRWTSEEDELLKDNVTKYGLVKGCKVASALLGRTAAGCQIRVTKLKKAGFAYKDSRIGMQKETLEIIKECVGENPNNLTAAFKRAAERTGLKEATISQAWYSKKGKKSRDSLGICFCTVGSKSAIQNRKNCVSAVGVKHSGIINWIKKVFRLH